MADDDPWEFWFKFEGDELIREDDEPLNDPKKTKKSKPIFMHGGMRICRQNQRRLFKREIIALLS